MVTIDNLLLIIDNLLKSIQLCVCLFLFIYLIVKGVNQKVQEEKKK